MKLTKKSGKKRILSNQMKYYFLAKIFVSIKLPDPIHETGFPKLSFITLLCLKFGGLPLMIRTIVLP